MYYTVIKHDGHLRTREKDDKQKKTLFHALYFGKTWVFDQSDRVQGPIYIIINK